MASMIDGGEERRLEAQLEKKEENDDIKHELKDYSDTYQSDDIDDDVWDETAPDNEFREHLSVRKHLEQAGFREGKAKAEEVERQRGFDQGFSDGWRVGSLIGPFIGFLICHLNEASSDDEEEETKRKKIVEEIIQSLMHKGSQEKYSSTYLEDLLLLIQQLPTEIQAEFQRLTIALRELDLVQS